MAEMAETASLLERAGLITIFDDGDDRVSYLLTDDGERANRMRTMGRESDVDAVLDALLGADPRPATRTSRSTSVPIRPSI